jgi:drug/metabolite transporter (DMT)-like permease
MKIKDLIMYILAALITACFFTVLYLLIYKPMPQENKDVLYLAIGALIGFMGTIVTYFFGSSKGSAEKTKLLEKNMK